jgi:hypothetical protein
MRTKVNWDALGMGTSLACAVHCALLPLFLSTLPLFGINIIHNPIFEGGMIALAFIIGCVSLYHGYKKHHHKLLPVFIFAAGIIFLVVKQFFTAYETWLLIPAVILIISAHLLNYRSCRVHDHGHEGDCNH